jgi:hypothetical protein
MYRMKVPVVGPATARGLLTVLGMEVFNSFQWPGERRVIDVEVIVVNLHARRTLVGEGKQS